MKITFLSPVNIRTSIYIYIYVVVNFSFQLIYNFPLFWGIVMYANEFKTKEKQNSVTEIKNLLQHTHSIYAITCRQNLQI